MHVCMQAYVLYIHVYLYVCLYIVYVYTYNTSVCVCVILCVNKISCYTWYASHYVTRTLHKVVGFILNKHLFNLACSSTTGFEAIIEWYVDICTLICVSMGNSLCSIPL